MAAPPQWDSQNRAPPPPSQNIQQLGLGQPQQAQVAPSTQISNPRRPSLLGTSRQSSNLLGTNSSGHSRASSFFGAFRTKPATATHTPEQSSSTASLLSRQPSQMANGHNEFGVQGGQISQQASPSPSGSPPAPASGVRQDALVPRPSIRQAPAALPLHAEIRSVVALTLAHAHKIYFSGPLVKRMERQADGQRPSKDEGWTEVWAQLGGTTLSIWDMKAIEEANKVGQEVPPTYINMTDAFVQVLGSVTVPPTMTAPSKRYSNVLTLNTAGSNLLLFSCPTTAALLSWAAALRLSAWEKSRLEEIYTAHLIRITLNDGRDTRTTLVRGRIEGWVRIRVAGQTDWKKVWVVVSKGSDVDTNSLASEKHPSSTTMRSKKRMSSLFSRDQGPQSPGLPPRPMLSIYSSPKPRDKKVPLLTMSDITQAFAVYPERPELISRSTLLKLEGLIGEEDMAMGMKNREGWLLLMPEIEGGGQATEMLRWIVGVHDAFELYGRPRSYTWDPRDPTSLMFAYPVGPHKDLLFLDREKVESLDPREDRTSSVRSRLLNILLERMRGIAPGAAPRTSSEGGPPSLPPLDLNRQPTLPGQRTGPQLPPLRFDANARGNPNEHKPLTPITERSHTNASRSMSGDFAGQRSSSLQTNAELIRGDSQRVATPLLDRPMNRSPSPTAVPAVPEKDPNRSNLSLGKQNDETPGSRPDSKFSQEPARPSMDSQRAVNPANAGLPVSKPGSIKEYPFPTAPPLSSPQSPRMGSERSASPSVSARNPSHSMDVPRKDSIPSPHSGLAAPYSTLNPQTESSIPPQTSAVVSPLSSPVPPPESATYPQISISTSSYSASPPLQKEMGQFQQSTDVKYPYPTVDPMQRESDLSQQMVVDASGPERKSVSSQQSSVVTSPYSGIAMSGQPQKGSIPATATESRPSAVTAQAPSHKASEDSSNFTDDTGAALYYIQQYETEEQNGASNAGSRRKPTTISEDDESSTSEYGHKGNDSTNVAGGPMRHPTSSTVASSNLQPATSIGARDVLGRKPSGARAPQNNSRQHLPESVLSRHPEENDSDMDDSISDREQPVIHSFQPNDESLAPRDNVEDNADALAALSFLNQPPSPAKGKAKMDISEPQGTADEPSARGPSPVTSSGNHSQFKSTFAPSKNAVERKARSQEKQEAHDAAVKRPGRLNGKKRAKPKGSGAWNDSSEEEEDDSEDEDDDDADSDTEPLGSRRGHGSAPAAPQRPSVPPAQVPAHRVSPSGSANDHNTYSHLRPPRTLPQIPSSARQPVEDEYRVPPRIPSDEGRRTYYDDPQIRSQAEFPKPGAARQTVWSQALDPGHTPGAAPELANNNRDTFVQLEAPDQSMTKAFTPQGLLSAGIQDKQDRSAKKQEEMARESGASLINVPNKPPPPQTGLLGAITAHERERKREGGVGAALTEREREKRIAEERQRKFDEQQRQQMEQMNQGGQMYSPQFPGYNPMVPNPMMANPMMLNPMMTGGYMGYPGMMGGYNQQHLYAAQQAAQAYQQAMMVYSQAGSQNGGEGGNGAASPPITPMGTGGQMGAPMGGTMPFDPRMTMMGMPMMPPMGMPMGMQPTGMQPMGMQPAGMQATGVSQFDSRFGPSSPVDTGLRPPGDFGTQGYGQPPMQTHGSSHSSLPHASRTGSPAGHRPMDSTERPRSPLNPTQTQ